MYSCSFEYAYHGDAMEYSSSSGRGQSYIYLLLQQQLTREAQGGKESWYQQWHTMELLTTLASRNQYTVALRFTLCTTTVLCTTIHCSGGRNQGISINRHSDHLPSRHSAKKSAFSAKVSTWANTEETKMRGFKGCHGQFKGSLGSLLLEKEICLDVHEG